MTLSATQIPPYVSHRTFTTFLESLKPGIPDRIDGSVFDASFSGTSRKQVTSALKSLFLIDDDLRPTRRLELLVRSEGENRRSAWRELLEEVYAPLFRLDLEAATPFQLREELRKLVRTESMLIKCESFFKHAAADAGIRLSPHIMRRKLVRRRKRPEPRTSKPEDAATRNQTPNEPVRQTESTADAPSVHLESFADKILEKYPQFDPNWSEEARENWLAGMERLTNALIGQTADMNSNQRNAN